ncbi:MULTISPECIES: N-acetylmuramoyl-L-alanine amidase CwlD [Caldanaerobacter]|uniref:N-acetylmuramoyl-L-alanine amidase n=2 Tax=Caldanaerobacter subterraneus TaxID=911092 RepID=Q8R820_CALS4|nr:MULTISPECIES: N-acetylmuramoyl-L-alanine amidase CwlD [Caldanaerobacter]AAM25369.1 N-acetylmuramoyl-L-alanine amidase [Caldanaerobacter subterraneus subsp. tengcongensis MB4]MCS3915025.1 N-acetylmuramoyl-L-alanine amidase [Caldanaerobacter subterraneus subsp. tengcongensis MB4]MDI3518491.1 N-acetylmuramoyl-L-alanine amidase [Caldanaerobacter sp.]MDK2794133.1 N-acetylmuramoyl-L-alanine amidase [Caldanaerobacter sp.]TCO67560.1 N-acetylmuramoyl-L-alanine amidase [Caldanaerobacter subterraneus]
MRLKRWLLFGLLLLVSVFSYNWQTKNLSVFTTLPIMNKIIVIDAGHGGYDPGKPGKYGKDEDELNLEIAQKLKELIEHTGGIAVMIREDDSLSDSSLSKDLKNRVLKANQVEGDVLISIHQNSFSQSKYKGAQVFYQQNSEKGKLLAELIQEELRKTLDPNNDRMAKSSNSYYILRNAKMPAVIVECGFMSNPGEERLLNDPNYQYKIAWAIYKGIIAYFQKTSE